ncbi:MAG TPA: GldG family protein, partial [Candidatus Binatia bacterium]|nr:GldG family protein [Candidatus Binatia bacterium]
KVLGQLAQDLQIHGFFEKGENAKISDLIRSYSYQTPRVKFTAVDPDRHPELVKQYKVQQLNTLHIAYGNESTNVTDPTEENVTNAIIKLTKATKKNVLFLTGHGEPKLDDRENTGGYAAAKGALENENYQVKDILLSTQPKVPDDTSLLIIAAPEKPLDQHENEAIDAYLKNGGRILVMMPTAPSDGGLKALLKNWGVEIGDDIVVDQQIRLFQGPTLGVEPIAETFNNSHPITRDFKERTIFPLVRSVEPAKTENVDSTWLVRTSETSWAEKDIAGIFKAGRASLGPDDKKGPISVAAAATAQLKKLGVEKPGDAKVVAVGTAAFANNRYINIFFNRDLFLNSANWLVGQEELISIRSRSIRASRVQLTETESAAVFYLSFLILPEILLIIGLAVWWRRR